MSSVRIPEIQLLDGTSIPQLGFGTYLVTDGATDVVSAALEVGYRHLDTAQMYGNEADVGEAIRRSGIDRDELYVTSKLDNGNRTHDAAMSSFDDTMDRLGLDELDLFLIHWPLPNVADYVERWRTMEAIRATGRVRSIGVSNFTVGQLRDVLEATDTVPVVNQIEIHPYLVQHELREFHAEHGIGTEAWSPIGRGRVLDDPAIVEIADRVHRTPAQVVLRWHLQRGDIVFPKTTSPDRMRENIAVFDFELDEDAMTAITALDRDYRTGPDPETFDG
jgi:2,5-diketo-D-gluconate reductase A